jgi:carboxypeptidase C (cathepsin A)
MSVFSYVLSSQVHEVKERPVIFIFNGGPGGSSAPLHLSGIGPKRAEFSTDLSAGILPPYRLLDSPNSLLASADLVFMDPVGTGFGTVSPDADLSQAFSVEGDAKYFADAIGSWVSLYGRFDAPKFLLGESYGTHRAPFVASELHGYRAVTLSGVILLGQALNVQETLERPGNVTAAISNLPLMAATAWYHKLGSLSCSTVGEAVDAAIEFAHREYAPALLKGNTRSAAETREMAEQLAAITGIKVDKYLGSDIRLTKSEFARELIPGCKLGGNDTRYVSERAKESFGELDFDAATTHTMPVIQASIARYLIDELGVPRDVKYRLLDMEATGRWDWSDSASDLFTNMGKPSPFHTYPYSARLTRYLRQVPDSRVFIGTGYYDSLTTVGAVEHLLRQYPLPLDRVVSRRYEAGHMMYSDPAACGQLLSDLHEFLAEDVTEKAKEC